MHERTNDTEMALTPSALFQVPNVDLGSTPGYIAPKLYTNPELEEFVVLTFTGLERLKNFGQLLSA